MISTDTLSNIENLSKANSNIAMYAQHSLTIREQALKEAALALGSQSALHEVAQEIDTQLTQLSRLLYQDYNFNDLLLPNHVLPPVIQTAHNVANLSIDSRTIQVGGQIYHIISQARFVTTVPTWRDYLWMNYPMPDLPDPSLLPQNSDEQTFWKKMINKAWQQGYEQGVDIFKAHMNELNQDFTGMLLYRRLVIQHEISQPYVQKNDYGITGNKNKIIVDNQTYHLNSLPGFQISGDLWQPVLQESK